MIYFIISIIIFIIILLCSFIEIEVQNLEYDSRIGKIDKKFKIYLRLKFLNKITYFKRNIKNIKFDRKKFKTNFDKIDGVLNKGKPKKALNQLKNLNISAKKITINLDVGTDDAAVTAIGVGFISTIIVNFVTIFAKENSEIRWKVLPIYEGKNTLNIFFEGIFSLKLTHIIFSIFK